MLRKRSIFSEQEDKSQKRKYKPKKIKLLENFVSIQGEGHTQGMVAVFLRFKTCNLTSLCHICDTALRMKTTPEAEYSIMDIIEQGKYSNYNYVITGGEPSLPIYHDEIVSFVSKLYLYTKENNIDNCMVLFETNGFKIVELIEKIKKEVGKSWFKENIHVVYSPKNYIIKENKTNKEIVKEIETKIGKLLELGISDNNLCLKMVAFDKNNKFGKTFMIINMILSNNVVPKHIIYIMPEGVSKEELLSNNKIIYEYCITKGINFSTRIHIMHNMY